MTELRLSSGGTGSLVRGVGCILCLVDSLPTELSHSPPLDTRATLHATHHVSTLRTSSLNPQQPPSRCPYPPPNTPRRSHTKRVRRPAPHTYPRSLTMSLETRVRWRWVIHTMKRACGEAVKNEGGKRGLMSEIMHATLIHHRTGCSRASAKNGRFS